MATGLLRSQPPSPAIWRYAAALIESATRLAPDEPRFTRFLIEAAGRGGDNEPVLKALDAHLRLNPFDQVAQTQKIDGHLARRSRSIRKSLPRFDH